MARIVRVQLNIRSFPVNLGVLERLAELAAGIAQVSGEQNLTTPVEIDLDLTDGSLKVAGVVVGVLFSTYYFVGNYKAFKEGVVEICKDANTFGDDFCDKFLQAVGISKNQVSKQKVEVQTPEKLRILLDELEQLDKNWKLLSEDDRSVLLAGVASQLDRVLRDMSDEDRSAVVASLKFEALPLYTHWPRLQLPEPPRVGRKPEERATKRPVQRQRLRVKKKVFIDPKARSGSSASP